MKMVLGAPAVHALIALDPAGTVTLAKNAAEQVASEIAHRVTKERFEASFHAMMANAMRQQGWGRGLSDDVKRAINDHLTTAAAEFVKSLSGGPIQAALRDEARAAVSRAFEQALPAMEKRMEDRANSIMDRVVANRLVAALAAADSNKE